jgi:DNA uptake protein ComE-like DNA-binding protein
VDEGRPVSYLLLARSTPVYASGGEVVGRVRKVLCEPAADIFDGLELDGVDGRRYVPAEHVASIHERGVDLAITRDEVAELLAPPHRSRIRWDLEQPPPHAWHEVAEWLLDHLPHGHPAHDDRVQRAREHLAARRRALQLASENPRLAVEAGIGRPELSGGDDGGVIDVNHAAAEAVATLPGIDLAVASQIVDMRGAIGGFASLEELGMLLELPGDCVEHLRDRTVFLPD